MVDKKHALCAAFNDQLNVTVNLNLVLHMDYRQYCRPYHLEFFMKYLSFHHLGSQRTTSLAYLIILSDGVKITCLKQCGRGSNFEHFFTTAKEQQV